MYFHGGSTGVGEKRVYSLTLEGLHENVASFARSTVESIDPTGRCV